MRLREKSAFIWRLIRFSAQKWNKLSDVEKVCREAPQAAVIASHLDSVNHALLSRKDIIEFAKEKGFSEVRVPKDGERVEI